MPLFAPFTRSLCWARSLLGTSPAIRAHAEQANRHGYVSRESMALSNLSVVQVSQSVGQQSLSSHLRLIRFLTLIDRVSTPAYHTSIFHRDTRKQSQDHPTISACNSRVALVHVGAMKLYINMFLPSSCIFICASTGAQPAGSAGRRPAWRRAAAGS